MTAVNVIDIKDLHFRWPTQTEDCLNLPSLTVKQGDHLFIKGPSGSGKTTLLNLLSGIFTPQKGQLKVLDTELSSLSALKRDQFRGDHLGVVFQQFNLLPYLSTLENILLPLSFSKRRQQREPHPKERALELLALLQLPQALIKRPVNQLSIGQQQRVAVARALMGNPELIIADEPTSALDTDNRDRFIECLFSAADAVNATLVFVSHDSHLAKHFTQQLDLSLLNQVSASNSTQR
ncbi:ABC transporter ATP-binding protein [Thiomicrorhabdus hydrogeniphila]